MNAVAKNLKRLRTRQGMTQEELAERLHVTRQAVSNWETAKTQPDIETLMVLAEALGTDANELIYGPRSAGEPCYARYQKKHVICAAVCAALVLVWLLMEIRLVPYLKRLQNATFETRPLRFYMLFVQPAALFAAGVLLPALASLWADIRLRGTWLRRSVVLAGVLSAGWYLLWLFCFFVYCPPALQVLTHILVMSDKILLRIGPLFLSGVCFFLGLDH